MVQISVVQTGESEDHTVVEPKRRQIVFDIWLGTRLVVQVFYCLPSWEGADKGRGMTKPLITRIAVFSQHQKSQADEKKNKPFRSNLSVSTLHKRMDTTPNPKFQKLQHTHVDL